MANAYLAGNKVRLSCTFTDATAALVDPTTVNVEYALAGAATTTKAYPADIVRDSIGAYHYDVDTTGMSGVLTYEWISTGTGQAATTGQLFIQADPV